MAKHKIDSVSVVIDGVTHTWEGEGTLTVIRTYIPKEHQKREYVARVEVMMPVPAEFVDGENTTPTVSLP